MSFWFAAAWFSLVAAGCADDTKTAKEPAMNLQITSTAFAEGRPIPDQIYLRRTECIAAVAMGERARRHQKFRAHCRRSRCAGGHLGALGDLQPAARLKRACRKHAASRRNFLTAQNKASMILARPAYGGPCPPPGKPHRYFFKIYALDTVLSLKSGATKKELLKAMDGHVLAQGQLIGTYQRQ